MAEEEKEQKLSTRLEYILNNTAIIPIFFLLFFVRPAEGYIQRIEFLLFLIENGLLLENISIWEITSLLPLLIIIPLLFYRERVSAGINNFMIAQITKEVIKEFDKDSDETLSKEEYQGLFSAMMEDPYRDVQKHIDSDALFDKYDSNKDGKLDGDEISSLILELFDGDRITFVVRGLDRNIMVTCAKFGGHIEGQIGFVTNHTINIRAPRVIGERRIQQPWSRSNYHQKKA